jgi:Asp-tRNA(Asn)/Glu-tRNA(Gln) amidotransferase A subunit family amidase
VSAVEAALERAALVEPHVHAFAWLDPERARALAAASGGEGPLAGVPVGLKDVIDTAGVPTECGSALFVGRVPAQSAEVARRLEEAGAILLGKTVTAECAFLHPGPTRNPWDTSRTPGGSSMGSAAAVAAGVVPMAVGTQTNGSVIRPAAYCGVVGFKPSAGFISKEGVLRFSGTLDQMGGFTRTVHDAARLAAAMAGEPVEHWWAPGGWFGAQPRLAVARTAEWEHATPAARERFEADVAALREAGAEIVEPDLPEGLDACVPVHRTIMQYEGAQSLGAQVAAHPDKASETLRRYVEDGARTSGAAYEDALRERERLIAEYREWSADFDAVLTLPAAGEAPGPETTGDPRFCTRWTFVGAPALTLPTGLGPAGLPLGLQVVGVPGDDRRLIRAASWIERVLPAPQWTPDRLKSVA